MATGRELFFPEPTSRGDKGMTRKESWQVKGTTLMLLRHVTSLGRTVSVFRFPSSLLGKPGFVEMHAMDLSADPRARCIARVVDARSKHLGTMHPETGEMIKPRESGRNIDL